MHHDKTRLVAASFGCIHTSVIMLVFMVRTLAVNLNANSNNSFERGNSSSI
jgi:hypothetical protein